MRKLVDRTGGCDTQTRDCEEECRQEVDGERSCIVYSDGGEVQATRLFDKLDQLEKRWQSQKSQQRKIVHAQSSSGREQPEALPNIAATFSTVATFESEQRQIGSTDSFSDQRTIGRSGSFADQREIRRSDSFASTVSAQSEKLKKSKKKAPRIVSMFDRLYQKGKAKSITRCRAVAPEAQPKKLNRNKRRQLAAATIQGVFRGRRFRKKLQRVAERATVIQNWWRNVLQRLYYLRFRGSILILQSLLRRQKALQEYQRRFNAVLVIQRQQRVCIARLKRQKAVEEREKRIRESDASLLIQGLMMKDLKVLRQQRVECISLMVEETPSDEVELLDDDDAAELATTPSGEKNQQSGQEAEKRSHEKISEMDQLHGSEGGTINQASCAEQAPRTLRWSYYEASCQEDAMVATDTATPSGEDHQPPVSSSAVAHPLPQTPTPDSASRALYRAAKLRRQARSSSRCREQHIASLDTTTPERTQSCRYRSIAYEYLPAKKTYWALDEKKAAKVPVLQRWARRQLEQRSRRSAAIGIQCAWKTYRAHFYLISGCLLKQWSVRVDFHQEETTSNPILRQKVRLLALTNAIRQVNDECIHQEVMRTSYSFVVSWKTEASIYFGEDQVMAELNRCSIHVTCEAHRHPLWDSWSTRKKFTILSKAALMRSFANQCARLSRASVLMQSLKMRRILLKMAREKKAALTIQRFLKQYGQDFDEMKFLKIARHAAVRLQSWWRMTMCIYYLEIQDMSACSIQAVFRGYKTRTIYISCYQQIVVLQSLFRGRRQRILSKLERRSALQIQKVMRGHLVRLTNHNRIYAALAIQDWYRAISLRVCMSKIRLSYSILQCLVQRQALLQRLQEEQSAIRIQSLWRMSICRADFSCDTLSIVTIQALHRGAQARKSFLACLTSCLRIQSLARGKKARLRRASTLLAAKKLQSVWRMRRQFTCFVQVRFCALVLQRNYRGYKSRITYKALQEVQKSSAATRLQAWWRMIDASESYTALCLSVLDIQRFYRGFQARDFCQKRLLNLYALDIQRCYRAHKARKLCKEIISGAAVKIQKWWRMSNALEVYSVIYLSVLDIQRLYRGFQARAAFKTMLEAHRTSSAVQLQAWWRMHDARDTYTELCMSAIDIQRIYQGYRSRQFCKAVRTERLAAATVRLQAWWRMSVASETYSVLYICAIDIQRLCRGYQARKAHKAMQALISSSLVVQRVYRGYMTRKACKINQICLATVDIQRVYRGKKVCKHYKICKAASIGVQRIYRGYYVRKTHQVYPVSAVAIQRVVRGSKTRKEYQILLQLRMYVASVQVQAWWRMLKGMSYAKCLRSALRIQRVFRRYIIRKDRAEKLQAIHAESFKWLGLSCYAVTLQKIYRGVGARRRYHALLGSNVAACLIQKCWDDYRERKATNLYNAIVLVQKVYRGHQVRQQIDPLEAFLHSGGTVCRYLTQRHFSAHRQMQLSALRIQSLWRGAECRHKLLSVEMAARVIQLWWRQQLTNQWWRSTLTSQKLLNLTNSAVSIQATYRRFATRSLVVRRIHATLKIQSWYRMARAMQNLEEVLVGAIIIQAVYRGFRVRSHAEECNIAAKTLQSWHRRLTAKKWATAAAVIQSWFCGLMKKQRMTAALTKIQSCYRASITRSNFQNKMAAVLKMQAFWRRSMCFLAFTRLRQYLTSFQSIFRGFAARCRIQSELEAARTIKLWYQTRKAELYRYERCRRQNSLISDSSMSMHDFGDENSAVDVTREYQLCSILTFPADKTELSATLVQTTFRTYASRQAYLKLRSAVIKIQSFWRAYLNLECNICTRAVVHDEGIEVERMARPHQVVWLKKLRTLAGILVQCWWRAKTQRRKYLLIQKEMTEQREKEALTFKNSKLRNDGITSEKQESTSSTNMNTTTKVTLQKPFWLFNPEVVLSLPVSLASCLDSVQPMDAFCGEKNRRANVSAQKIQRCWLAHKALVKSKEAAKVLPPTKKECAMTKPVTRSQIHKQLLLINSSVTHLQAWWRLNLLRIHTEKVAKATKIESFVRGVLARGFVIRLQSAIRIQRRYHVWSANAKYFTMRQGFISLQREWLRYACLPEFRARIAKRNGAVITLQRRARQRIQDKIALAIRLQRQWRFRRGIISLQRRAKRMYGGKSRAACLIQQTWRMFQMKFAFNRFKTMATRVQSQWRTFRGLVAFQKQRIGFVHLQLLWVQKFQAKTDAAICLQRQWRMSATMVAYRQDRSAATLLSKVWRRHSCRLAYRNTYSAITMLQRVAKGRFVERSKHAVLLQRLWRGHSRRRDYLKVHGALQTLQNIAKERFFKKTAAAILLQKTWKMQKDRKNFSLIVRSSIRIQQLKRRSACRSSYNKMRRGFLALQKRTKQALQSKTQAAVVLQRNLRMEAAFKKYASKRKAAIRVQAQWRRFSLLKKYKEMRLGFGELQGVAKRAYQKKTSCVIILQSCIRMQFARTIYKSQKSGAILVQRQWRRNLCERRFNIQLNGFSACQHIAKQYYRKRNSSAIFLQSLWRMTSARFTYKQERAASIVLQTRYRGAKCKSAYAVMRPGFISLQVLAKLWFRIKKTCAVKIQAATRRMLRRKRYQVQILSVVRIQSAFRGFVQRRNLAVLRWLHSIASTMIASWWRRISYEFKYQNFRCATLVLQTGFRRRRREAAITRIQSWLRCCHAAQSFRDARRAAIAIQGNIRAYIAGCRRHHAAASVIQKTWVASQQRFLVRCLLVLGRAKAAIALQKWWRSVLLVRHHRRMLFEALERRRIEAAGQQRHKKQPCDPITMLCNFDFASLKTGLAVANMVPWGSTDTATFPVAAPSEKPASPRRSYHHRRRHHRDERLKLRGAIVIQRRWRQIRRSQAKEKYYKSVSAAWIQCVWRGYSARRKYSVMLGNKAAKSLQMAWHDIHQRRVETKQVMKIQAQWRMRRQRWKYEDTQVERQISCILVQSVWRMHRSRQKYLEMRSAAVKIQSRARRTRARNAAAKKIQRQWWVAKLRGTIKNRKSGHLGSRLPAMVFSWFALKGGSGA